ncbi:hypothetical protein [Shewanella atlantica]|uniref:hypothetical protein n=1 Tax=Shewanella atlantica TaxID=271099 RepID=UPI003734FA4F
MSLERFISIGTIWKLDIGIDSVFSGVEPVVHAMGGGELSSEYDWINKTPLKVRGA